MQNKRILEMKAYMQVYNYVVRHIKGVKNSIADQLSRRPTWLVDKDDKETDYDFEHDLDFEEGELSALISIADKDADNEKIYLMLFAHHTSRRVWFLECREKFQILHHGVMVRGHGEEAPAAYREFEFLEPLVLLPDIEVPFNDDTNISVYSGTVFRGPLLCTLHEPVSFNVFVRYHPAARQSGPRGAPSRVAPDAIDQALAEHPWLTAKRPRGTCRTCMCLQAR